MTYALSWVRPRSETVLAMITLFAAGAHFALETWFHVRWGQPLSFLVVDYISTVLMAVGATISLRARPLSASGLLSGAWGFAVCLAYRSTFDRVEMLRAGDPLPNGEPITVTFILVAALLLSSGIFVWSMIACLPQRAAAL